MFCVPQTMGQLKFTPPVCCSQTGIFHVGLKMVCVPQTMGYFGR
jgi:hypothetical protein